VRTERNNGGPAFPRLLSTLEHEGDQMHSGAPGMTLRDYFAAKAMQTLLSDMQAPNPSSVAEWAYKHADAMLAVRETQS